MIISLTPRNGRCKRRTFEKGAIVKDKFGCALDCMDGRTTDAVTEYIRERYGVDWVDSITEPGINGILARNTDTSVIEKIKEKVIFLSIITAQR